jgi:hypothetical protein
MPTRAPRNLTSAIAANPEKPRRWKAVGGDRIDRCTFCDGSPTEAVVGCPDDGGAPVIWGGRDLRGMPGEHDHDAVRCSRSGR